MSLLTLLRGWAAAETPPINDNPLFDGTLKVYIGGTNAAGVNTGGLDVPAAACVSRSWGNTNPGGFGDAGLRLAAPPASAPFSATGGTKSVDGAYTVHKFTGSGTLVCTGSIAGKVLRIGGGAGGSSGGGGAGGVIPEEDVVLAGSMPVTVGAGGAGANPNAANGTAGGDTTFAGTTAKGGGYGGSYWTAGGNGGNSGAGPGGAGGNGIVVVRYLTSPSPWAPYDPLVVKGAAVLVTHGTDPIVELYEGEITNDVSHATIQGGQAFYDVTCAGLWWKAGQRKDYCQVFADDDTAQWFALDDNAKSFATNTDGMVEIRLEKGQSAKANKPCSLYYWLDGGMGDPAGYVQDILGTLRVDVGTVAGNWHAWLSGGDTPWDASGSWTTIDIWDVAHGNATVTAGTPYYNGANKRCLRLQLYSDAVVASVNDDKVITLARLSLVASAASAGGTMTAISKESPAIVTLASHHLKAGDRIGVYASDSVASIDGWQRVATTPTTDTFTMTGVNVTGSAGTTGYVETARTVDDAMAEIAVATGLATSSDLQADKIGNANWSLNTRPHTTRASAIETFAMTNVNPIDYGFWDDGVFYCQDRAVSIPAANDYLIDSNGPGIDFNVVAATEDSPTVVKVLYLFRDVDGGSATMPDGTLLSVYRPSAPTWTDASVVVDVWDQWADLLMTTAQANDLGDQILAWLDDNQYQGTITIATPTITRRDTATKLLAYVRAGDYIEDSNLATGPLMITGYSMDPDSGVATLSIGENVRDFVARLTKARPQVGSGSGIPGAHPPKPGHR
jgi:hypothetical protein